MKKANIVCAVIGMAFGAGAFIQTFTFKEFQNVPVGPEFFPRYLASGLFICCLVLFLQQFKAGLKDRPAPAISFKDKGMRRLLLGVVIIVIYALLWEPVGFIVVTPIALFALMYLLGLRRYPAMAVFSFAAMAVVFGAFRFFLSIEMPMGILYGIL